MVLTSSFLPLKAKVEVRAATLRFGTLARRLSSSSESPSEKYSCSLSELRFTSGSTAMQGPGAVAAVAPGESAERARCTKYQTTIGEAARRAMTERITPARVPRSEPGAVLSIRPELTSKIHASATTTGKPPARPATTRSEEHTSELQSL